jgi:pantoate--beta-alanine ligase
VLEVVATLGAWRERTGALRGQGRSLGVTLTMGALHDGHVALFERAVSSCDVALATIFVNPLQFGDPADLARYPRDLGDDLTVCERAGIRLVLAPSVAEMWPAWPAPTATTVHVAGLADVLEGAGRPGHFDGVAVVVAKLLLATGRCNAFFGEKDYQQLCVVRQLVRDLALEVEVVGCPTVREPDGLARSSRNARLSNDGRRAATVLWRALEAGRVELERTGSIERCEAAMRDVVAVEPLARLAYAAAVEPVTLRVPAVLRPGASLRLLVAALVEGVRLIDNAPAVVGAP